MDISVLVEPTADTEVFRRQLASLDAQSLTTDAYEVLVDGREVPAEALESARRLADHRPNVRVLVPDSDEDLLAQCHGTYIAGLVATDTLFPNALQRLLDAAVQHDVDVVIGRTVQGQQPVPGRLWSDQVLEGADLSADEEALVRRGARTSALTPDRVAVLTSYPTARRTPTDDEEPTSSPADRVIVVDEASWSNGRLELALTASGADLPPGDPRSVALLRHTGSLDTRLLPAQVVAEGSTESPVWRISVSIDLSSGDTPLANGVWQLLVQVGDPSVQPEAAVVAVPWSPCPPALLAGVPVVPNSLQGRFALDVGAIRHPLITAADPAQGSVTESAAGSLLVLPLPTLHLHATDALDGLVAQDKMHVPARIVVVDQQAQLEAYVSGPKSLSVLSAQFGSGRLQPTGLSLEIGGEGAMRLVKTKPPAPPQKPKAAPKPPAAKPATAKSQPAPKKKKAKPKPQPRQGVAAQLRRAVPKPLEPAVRRLAHNPLARRLYRRITR